MGRRTVNIDDLLKSCDSIHRKFDAINEWFKLLLMSKVKFDRECLDDDSQQLSKLVDKAKDEYDVLYKDVKDISDQAAKYIAFLQNNV